MTEQQLDTKPIKEASDLEVRIEDTNNSNIFGIGVSYGLEIVGLCLLFKNSSLDDSEKLFIGGGAYIFGKILHDIYYHNFQRSKNNSRIIVEDITQK